MRRRTAAHVRLLAAVVVMAVSAGAAQGATVLDFFNAPNNYPGVEAFLEDLSGYGDNVNAASAGGFFYGTDNNQFTPNVTIDFDGLQLWDTGYADLLNIAYVDSGAGSSRPPTGSATVTLNAAPGFLVRLDSVDLAGFGGNLDFDSITVTGGNVPFSMSNVPAPGNVHNTLNINVTGQQLVLTFNDGDTAESAGIDNLRFSQVVPEPGAIAVFALVIPALLRRRGALR